MHLHQLLNVSWPGFVPAISLSRAHPALLIGMPGTRPGMMDCGFRDGRVAYSNSAPANYVSAFSG